MRVTIKDITSQNSGDIPANCNQCLYWEYPEDFERLKSAKKTAELTAKKKKWFLQTLKEFGICGKIVYCKNEPIGYAQYCPSVFLPQTSDYGYKSVGTIQEGVVFLSCLYIIDEKMRNKGVGTKLLEKVIKDLKKRGFKAIETIARKGSSNNPSGSVELYLKKEFYVKDDTVSEYPLMRLNL
jgi:GNAT superfamily N-acetyltransferase